MTLRPPADEPLKTALEHHHAGRLEQALVSYRRLLDVEPAHIDALRGTAIVLLQAGRAEAGLPFVARALAANPNTVETHLLHGLVLENIGRFPDAANAYGSAVKLDPAHAKAAHNLGRMMLRLMRATDAIPILEQALSLSPRSAEILCDLGGAQADAGRPADALKTLDKAISLDQGIIAAHHNRANALRHLLRWQEAVTGYKRVLALDPRFVPALNALTEILGEHGRLTEALEYSRQALKVAPQDAEAHQIRALLLLRHGRLAEGFDELDWRLQPSPRMVPRRPFTQPFWQGENLGGRDMLIWTEQGVGDEIITASMIPDVTAKVRSCVIECSSRLAPIFRRSFPKAQVVARTEPPDPATQACDRQSPAWSLARWLRLDFSRFPRHDGYLQPDPERTAALRQKYQDAYPGKTLVGISWDSFARHGVSKRAPLDQWKPVLAVAGCIFMNIQYTPPGAAPAEAPLVNDPSIDPMADLDGALAQIAAMDIVITISNTAAHLAGASNKKVWTLLPAAGGSFWYWFRDRTDSPWYPSMRLFRQPEPGDWASVMEEVASELTVVATALAEDLRK